MTILVTGGAGYIGSHVCVELLRANRSVVIFDNFSNSSAQVIERIEHIVGIRPALVQGDIRNRELLKTTLSAHRCSAVIHLAGLKSAPESLDDPLRYYDTNVLGTFELLMAMRDVGTTSIVFSSSAAVYGHPLSLPLLETHPLSPSTPYGRTKVVIEKLLGDLAAADRSLRVAILRYFNPIGAHESGRIGESSASPASNLMPLILEVAVGQRPHLTVFGNDFDTPDGTGVRDFIHVMDLASGHLQALERLATNRQINVNLGTGRPCSVLEVVRVFSKVSGKAIPIVFAPRRQGDVESCFASPDLAFELLGWRPSRSLDQMCRDSWNWQQKEGVAVGA